MQITLRSTEQIVHVNNVPARIWIGTTDSGIEVHAFITRIAVDKDLDCTQFEKELQEHEPPKAELQEVYPLRMLI